MNPAEYETMFRVEERYWWYRGMRRIARRIAPALFTLSPGARLLDVGCGTGANLADMAPSSGAVRGVGLDLSFEALRLCRRRGLTRLVLGTAERLPFRSGAFRGVSCRDVLVSVPDDARALREIARVCAPGSTVFLTAAALRAFAGEQDVATHVLRRYSAPELGRLAESSGLAVNRAGYANFFLSPGIFVVRRLRAALLPGRDPSAVRSEFHLAPAPLNGLLEAVLGLEARLLARWRFPFGVTALLRASKQLD
ncbi:MAG: class I SAM-dependent methyltransferase [Thermoanaerobaculia bacterium]